jgi:hypothetical protein
MLSRLWENLAKSSQNLPMNDTPPPERRTKKKTQWRASACPIN